MGTLILASSCLGLGPEAPARSLFNLMTMKDPHNFQESIELLEDSAETYTIEDVLALPEDAWRLNQKESLNFGFVDKAIWVRFSIYNPNQESVDRFLALRYPQQNHVHFFEFDDNTLIQHDHIGDRVPFSERDINSRNYVFQVAIPAGKTRTYYLRLEGETIQIPLQLSTREYYLNRQEEEILSWGLYFGIVTVMVLYNLILSLKLKERSYPLYSAYITSYVLLQASMSGFAYQHLWPRSPHWGNISTAVFLGLTTAFLGLFIQSFLETKQRNSLIDKIVMVTVGLGFLQCALSFVVPFGNIVRVGILLAMVASLVYMTATVFALAQRSRSAQYFALAFGLFLVGVLAYGAQSLGLVAVNSFTKNGVTLGSAAEVILLSLALGDKLDRRQKKARREIEFLNDSLKATISEIEQRVEEKTRHIASVMNHIKQGIFTILPGLQIERYYSLHLAEILENKDIAGKNPMDLFFRKTDLSPDELVTIESVLIGSLGESNLNFQMNECHLPSNIKLNEKHLNLSWQSIDNEDEETEKIMVVVRDITELRKLEEQSEEQKKELKIIGTLIRASTDRCHSFFTQGIRFLEQNLSTIANHPTYNDSALKSVFINYHTFKASARDFDFKNLVNSLHQAESLCSRIRDDRKLWNQTEMTRDLEQIKEIFSDYARINYEVLGRNMERIAVFNKASIEAGLQLFIELDPSTREKFKELHSEFKQSYFDDARDIFKPIWAQARKLARSLNKPEPEIHSEIEEVWLSDDTSMTIQSVFSHLIRNSLDHGIEPADERESIGKASQGQLFFSLKEVHGLILIDFSDDGKGLNLRKIRDLAMKRGLCSSSLTDPYLIAELIFVDGLSSNQDNVTEISGRGVGMSAVRSIIESQGGSCQISLKGVPNEDGYVAFQFEIHLPQHRLSQMAA